MRTGRPKAPLVLTREERETLRKMRRGASAREVLRADIILDCAKGLSNRTVAALRGVNPMTVGKWRRRFGDARLLGLKDAWNSPKPEKREPGPAALPPDSKVFPGSVDCPKRVTLRDMAGHLGLHLSTVSLGLKDDPRLPAATRRRIRAAAEKMGYQPDPMARALAVYRQAIRPPSMHGTLALLIQTDSQTSQLMEVVQSQAARFGYKIETIDGYAAGSGRDRLTRILRSRGIQGVLVLPPPFGWKGPRRLRIDWEYFSSVVLGQALYHPTLHQVGNDHLENAKFLTRKLISLGYRRIGLCVDERYSFLHAGGGWEGGYFGEMRRLPDIPRPFYRKMLEPDAENVRQLKGWIQRERLEAMIVDTDHVALNYIYPHCREISMACLTCFGSYFSGINPQYERVWEAGVDFLVHLINTHQRGVPAVPRRLLLRGEWMPGHTLRRINLR